MLKCRITTLHLSFIFQNKDSLNVRSLPRLSYIIRGARADKSKLESVDYLATSPPDFVDDAGQTDIMARQKLKSSLMLGK